LDSSAKGFNIWFATTPEFMLVGLFLDQQHCHMSVGGQNFDDSQFMMILVTLILTLKLVSPLLFLL